MAYKFPDSKSCSPNEPAVFCTADRVLNLYNQNNEKTAKRISKKVREWFFEQAHIQGWNGVHFIPEVQSKHGAGCMLWTKQEQQNIEVNNTVLILINGTGE